VKQLTGKCGLALVALGLLLTAVQAQDYPTRTIRMVVGTAPGGSIDVEARIIAQKLGEVLGQQVVVENRPGASGMVGAEYVAKTDPDGYTIFLQSGDFITLSSLAPRTTFDPSKELLPLAMVSNNPLAIVAGANAPFNNVKELIDAATSSRDGLTYATYGVATYNNVIGQWIAGEAHIKLLHVPYHSGADAALGAAMGEVNIAIVSPASVYPALTEAGKVKVIALTGTEHPSYLPSSWPTLSESGLTIDGTVFAGVFGPIGMADAIVSQIDRAMDLVLQDESVRKRVIQIGFNPEYMNATAFAEHIRTDKVRYERIIRDAGIRVEQ
jgi:tripartite-type tricarboxylate transporter receptor subunit TctC